MPEKRRSKMAKVEMKQAAGFLLTGAVVGAAVALLYTPQSGARTRRDIKKVARKTADRLDDLQDGIRSQAADLVGNMTEIVKGGVEKASRGFENAKEYVEDGKSRLGRLIKIA
jgi:gas vesicle protein